MNFMETERMKEGSAGKNNKRRDKKEGKGKKEAIK
jgi:hypothetical protein